MWKPKGYIDVVDSGCAWSNDGKIVDVADKLLEVWKEYNDKISNELRPRGTNSCSGT